MITKLELTPTVVHFLRIKRNSMVVSLLLVGVFVFYQAGFSQQAPAVPRPPRILTTIPSEPHWPGEASLKGLKKIEVLGWATSPPDKMPFNLKIPEHFKAVEAAHLKIETIVVDSLRAAGFAVSVNRKWDSSKILDPDVALLTISLFADPAVPDTLRENPQGLKSLGLDSPGLKDLYMCSCRIELKQSVSLLRNSEVRVNATTFTQSINTTLIPINRLENNYTQTINYFIDKFTEIYDFVNEDPDYKARP